MKNNKRVYFFGQGEYNQRILDNISGLKSKGFEVFSQNDLPYHKELLENDKEYQFVNENGAVAMLADRYVSYLLSRESGIYLEIHKKINYETFVQYYERVKDKQLALVKETPSIYCCGVIGANGKLAQRVFKMVGYLQKKHVQDYIQGKKNGGIKTMPIYISYALYKYVNPYHLVEAKVYETKKVLLLPLSHFVDFSNDTGYYSVVGTASGGGGKDNANKANTNAALEYGQHTYQRFGLSGKYEKIDGKQKIRGMIFILGNNRFFTIYNINGFDTIIADISNYSVIRINEVLKDIKFAGR